jgi:hypothetical protein
MLNLLNATLRDLPRPRRDLIQENLALRQQILVLQRTNPKPPVRDCDRAFWVLLCHWWAGWRRLLRLVQPETVIKWHRKTWRMWWRLKSRAAATGSSGGALQHPVYTTGRRPLANIQSFGALC